MSNQEITREVLKNLTNENILSMNKTSLQEHLQAAVTILNTVNTREGGRVEAVLNILKAGPASILEIAEKVDISTKNVSSQLSYLRKAGWVIYTDNNQRKFLAASEPVVKEEEPEALEESTPAEEITE